MTDRRMPAGLLGGMGKVDDYQRGRDMCALNAANAASRQLREAWQTVAESYALLIALEGRPKDGFGVLPVSQDGDNVGEVADAQDQPPPFSSLAYSS
jgi:hypothetical protein